MIGFAAAKAVYLPLKGQSSMVGILAYKPHQKKILLENDNRLLLSIAEQIAVYLEKEIYREEAQKTSQ